MEEKSAWCTRCGVRRPAVDEFAHPQQAPPKLHEETWAGLLNRQGPRISREVEIIPGVLPRWLVLRVLITLLCHLSQAELFGTWLGWSQLGKTVRSGVWLFRCALQGENLFSSLVAAGDWKRRGRSTQRGRYFVVLRVLVHMRMGKAPLSGPHTGEHCWALPAGVWRAIAPLMKPWCAEGGADCREPEPLPGMELVCWLASR